MKHACGKVFDAKKEFICEDGDQVENFLLGINKISVKFKMKQTIYDYKLCGHQLFLDDSDYCYTDIKNNLINIVKTVDWTKPICVVNEMSGKIYSAIVKEILEEFIVVSIDMIKEQRLIFLFSLDGTKTSEIYSFMKLIAKNV